MSTSICHLDDLLFDLGVSRGVSFYEYEVRQELARLQELKLTEVQLYAVANLIEASFLAALGFSEHQERGHALRDAARIITEFRDV